MGLSELIECVIYKKNIFLKKIQVYPPPPPNRPPTRCAHLACGMFEQQDRFRPVSCITKKPAWVQKNEINNDCPCKHATRLDLEQRRRPKNRSAQQAFDTLDIDLLCKKLEIYAIVIHFHI